MRQSRLMSLVESLANVVAGLLVAVATQIAPLAPEGIAGAFST